MFVFTYRRLPTLGSRGLVNMVNAVVGGEAGPWLFLFPRSGNRGLEVSGATNWAELLCFRCTCLQLWPKIVLRKWLNISSKDSDFSADDGESTESEFEFEEMCQWERQLRDEERRLGGLGAESNGDFSH
ncbi:hypothetical protein IEQ34_019574 [Dendrobium chrysotoxum]|uniref:Uncharacterized protein n=1 Tax=Dendrobium chrysotoxum TaxID=161865 RepID=A0AAV7G832_DENCH|nr:hypothetical protein IEQ34_019574 [Dendrobium chrysotoxum]